MLKSNNQNQDQNIGTSQSWCEIGQAFLETIDFLTSSTESIPIESMPLFSESFGGFRPKEFTVLCGSTGTGKTTLLANWSASLLKQKVPHFVASVETGYIDFVARQMAATSGINFPTRQKWNIDVIKKFYDEHGDIFSVGNCYLSLYDNRINTQSLLSEIQWLIENKKIKIVFLDNLNFFLEITTHNQAIVEMDRVVHEFIMFCKRNDVHIVMVMHPKKTINGRVESEFDVKGSSTAVQEAHNVFLFNRPSPDNFNIQGVDRSSREIYLAKMRRLGQNVGRKIFLSTLDGVSYKENRVYDPF